MIQHTNIVRGIAGLLVSHLRASHMRASQFAKANGMCESTISNLLNDNTKNPTIRTLVNVLNGCKVLEDVVSWRYLKDFTGLAAQVIRLHEKKRAARKRAKRRAA